MTLRQIGLISETTEVTAAQVAVVASAVQKQILLDFAPHWEYQAVVSMFPSITELPPGYWPVVIRDNIGINAFGVHRTTDGLNPFALITFSGASWTVTASHEILEMIVDPLGTKTITGPAPDDSSETVEYLAEISDPCQELPDGVKYQVNGVNVSNFVLPSYYKGSGPGQYDFVGSLTKPRQLLPGGYFTWRDLSTGEWFSRQMNPGGTFELTEHGTTIAPANVHLRGTVDRFMTNKQTGKRKPKKAKAKKLALSSYAKPSVVEHYWKEQFAKVLGV